jgi:hypothetical protein
MNLYQIYWINGREGENGAILCHDKVFTQEQFDYIVQKSRKAIGGYQTFLYEIEEHMINVFGFKRIEYMKSCT